MKRFIAVAAFVVFGAGVAAEAQTWTEPKSGAAFPVQRDGMTLLGGGLRVKKIIFTFKAYAVALYVADEAIAGPLAVYKGAAPSPELYKAIQTGDFRKEVVLRFMRNLGKGRIQDAMRESLAGADPKLLDQFISYFPEVKEGQECVLRVLPGGTLESVMAGEAKPPIANRAFAEKVMGLYVGVNPIQEDIKAGVVARFGGEARAAETSGTVKSVEQNDFTVTDSSGKDWRFTVDKDTLVLARGGSHRMDRLQASGQPTGIGEFLAPNQKVLVKYLDQGVRMVAREVRVQ